MSVSASAWMYRRRCRRRRGCRRRRRRRVRCLSRAGRRIRRGAAPALVAVLLGAHHQARDALDGALHGRPGYRRRDRAVAVLVDVREEVPVVGVGGGGGVDRELRDARRDVGHGPRASSPPDALIAAAIDEPSDLLFVALVQSAPPLDGGVVRVEGLADVRVVVRKDAEGAARLGRVVGDERIDDLLVDLGDAPRSVASLPLAPAVVVVKAEITEPDVGPADARGGGRQVEPAGAGAPGAGIGRVEDPLLRRHAALSARGVTVLPRERGQHHHQTCDEHHKKDQRYQVSFPHAPHSCFVRPDSS